MEAEQEAGHVGKAESSGDSWLSRDSSMWVRMPFRHEIKASVCQKAELPQDPDWVSVSKALSAHVHSGLQKDCGVRGQCPVAGS